MLWVVELHGCVHAMSELRMQKNNLKRSCDTGWGSGEIAMKCNAIVRAGFDLHPRSHSEDIEAIPPQQLGQR